MVKSIPQVDPKLTVIKRLCLANGDEYDTCSVDLSDKRFEYFVQVEIDGKTVYVDPDFIISFETNKPKDVQI